MIRRMRGMRPEDIYALKGVSDPRLDPTGTTVAYVAWEIDREANEYRGNVWFAPVDGSAPPRRFTTGEKRDGQPRWSPDGTRLAFTSSRAEEEPGQLFVLPVSGGGEALRLTRLKEDVCDVAWSPDGRRIAFSSRVRDDAYEHEEDERRRAPRRITRLLYKLDDVGWTVDRRQQLFVVPADGSEEPRRLTEGEFENAQPAWSPDGKRIAFTSARTEDWDLDLVEDVYLVDADGGEPERLTDGDASCRSPVWSPDGRRIAFEYSPDPYSWPRHTQIAVIDVETRDWQRPHREPRPPVRPVSRAARSGVGRRQDRLRGRGRGSRARVRRPRRRLRAAAAAGRGRRGASAATTFVATWSCTRRAPRRRSRSSTSASSASPTSRATSRST